MTGPVSTIFGSDGFFMAHPSKSIKSSGSIERAAHNLGLVNKLTAILCPGASCKFSNSKRSCPVDLDLSKTPCSILVGSSITVAAPSKSRNAIGQRWGVYVMNVGTKDSAVSASFYQSNSIGIMK